MEGRFVRFARDWNPIVSRKVLPLSVKPTRTPVIPRAKRTFSVRNTFGMDAEPTRTVEGYAEPDRRTPAVDPDYVFPREDTLAFLLGLSLNDRILIWGPTGTGKTSLAEQVAARLNYNVVKIGFDGGITRDQLIGTKTYDGHQVVFEYGVLPLAYREHEGCIIVLDEWDAVSDECTFVLQRPLQKDDGTLQILENGGEEIALPEGHHIIATANTCGQGDETGLYTTGTRIQNYAQINRFSMTIKLGYLPADQEIAMLLRRFSRDGFNRVEAEMFVRVMNKIREGFLAGTLSAPLSSRDLIEWARKFIKVGDATKAAKYTFLNRMPASDAEAVSGIIQRQGG